MSDRASHDHLKELKSSSPARPLLLSLLPFYVNALDKMPPYCCKNANASPSSTLDTFGSHEDAHAICHAFRPISLFDDILECNHWRTTRCDKNTYIHSRDKVWDIVVLSNYMIDMEWLATGGATKDVNQPRSGLGPENINDELILISGENDQKHLLEGLKSYGWGPNRIILNDERAPQAHQKPSSLSCPIVRIIKPKLPIPYGTHHSKAALCIKKKVGIRVSIFTANFIHDDWKHKNQGIYVEDFPLKAVRSMRTTSEVTTKSEIHNSNGTLNVPIGNESTPGTSSRFEYDLIRYFSATGWTEARNILSLFDFSSASCSIVMSLPGYHPRGTSVGMWDLERQLAVNNYPCADIDSKPISYDCGLTWQYSSQGSLTDPFLKQFAAIQMTSACSASSLEQCNGGTCMLPKESLIGHSSHKLTKYTTANSTIPTIKVVFPTIDEVRHSVEGWRAGSSIPVLTKNLHHFINYRLYKWGKLSHTDNLSFDIDRRAHFHPRSLAMPHIKSYSKYFIRPDHYKRPSTIRTLEWFLLSSANLSRAAWGDVQKKGAQLMVRSYELGVLYTRPVEGSVRKSPFSVTENSFITKRGTICAFLNEQLMSLYRRDLERKDFPSEEIVESESSTAIFEPLISMWESSLSACSGLSLLALSIWRPFTVNGQVEMSVMPLLALPYDPVHPEPYGTTKVSHDTSVVVKQKCNAEKSIITPIESDIPWTVDFPEHLMIINDTTNPATRHFLENFVAGRGTGVKYRPFTDSLGRNLTDVYAAGYSHYGKVSYSAPTLNFSSWRSGINSIPSAVPEGCFSVGAVSLSYDMSVGVKRGRDTECNSKNNRELDKQKGSIESSRYLGSPAEVVFDVDAMDL
eukprot:Tbor_TRINITY_DN7414_c0_g1::TRINITY_DN7414_c0_g1_i1::g.14568::m.14568/K10862/TDP1; tyrosyl-DNA phosphodiesterase 1